MERSRLTAFAVCFLISSGQPHPFTVLVNQNVINATAGDSVVLSVRPSSPVSSGFWKFGTASIVAWTVEPPDLNIAYTKRNVELLFNTSLLLRSVALSDSGDYWVTMDSPAGKVATAKITLNVFHPFTIYAKCNEVNSTTGDTVLLSVVPSEEVKNGTWTFGGNVVAHWMGASPEVNPDYRGRAAVLTNASLQLKSVSVSDTGEYSVTMSTASGDTRTAKLYLNVFKPQPFTISMALSEINAEIGASVLMSVIVSGEVKNGSWAIGSRILFKWEGTIQNITDFTRYYKELLPNASLLLKSVQFYNRGRYKVTLESSSGVTATANVTLNVYSTHRMCTMYNTTLTLSVLLALICIFAFAILILKKHQTVGYETNDLLTVLCKGYRVCLSFVTVLAFNLILIFAIVIHKNVCAPGQRPVINFLAK